MSVAAWIAVAAALSAGPDRPPPTGPQFWADAARGDDRNAGSRDAPWRTIGQALTRLRAGDTLLLRTGTYREAVAVRLVGRPDAPVTLRAAPGETAVIDPGWAEFFDEPASAWEPVPGGAAGEFRSTRTYPNARDVLGRFGDTPHGLHTYHHAADLRADSELWEVAAGADPKTTDVNPVWCGPGLWYDATTGRIHIRLRHTHLQGVPNYTGETDPRKLRLVIAPFHAVPLTLDGARHVRVQDLTVRGAGYDTVTLRQASDVSLDNLTLWCGSYGIRALGTRKLTLTGCGLHGSVPPWCYRNDTSLRSYPGRPFRDVTRFGTHALLVPEAGREFEVFARPVNDDWEVAYCDFTDAHDGVYLGGVGVRFHHNRIDGLHDDGIYLSPMSPRYDPGRPAVHVYANRIGRCLTALAFGGAEKVTTDDVFIYRNVIDMRPVVPAGRPTPKTPGGTLSPGQVMGDHGSPPWPAMTVYHNTFLVRSARASACGVLSATHPERPRRVFNNLFVHEAGPPVYRGTDTGAAVEADGNVYGGPGPGEGFFKAFRASSPKLEARSRAGDPRLVGGGPALRQESPAVNAGVPLPAAWPDPLRAMDTGAPDAGAVPLGAAPPEVGRAARR
jgi:hypothetical protein